MKRFLTSSGVVPFGQIRDHRVERFERQVGVDRLGAVAGKRAELVDLVRFARLDDEADRGS